MCGFYFNMASGCYSNVRLGRSRSARLITNSVYTWVSEWVIWLSEWHICISESPKETLFNASRFHEFKNDTWKLHSGEEEDKKMQLTSFSAMFAFGVFFLPLLWCNYSLFCIISIFHFFLGVPSVITIVTLAVSGGKGYGRDSSNARTCWLSVESGLIWLFVAPASFVLLVKNNTVLFIA